MSPRRRAAAVALALGVLVVVPACSAASGSPSANPTDADRRYVAVLARHVRHEADLAETATARLVAVDADAQGAAATLEADGRAQADALDALLRQWGVDSRAEADLFAGAVGIGTLPPGTVVYGCSLAGPLDDVSQVKAAAPRGPRPQRYSQLAMTAAVEGRALAATDRAELVDAARHAGDIVDAFQRDVLRAVARWLPTLTRPALRIGRRRSVPTGRLKGFSRQCRASGTVYCLGFAGTVGRWRCSEAVLRARRILRWSWSRPRRMATPTAASWASTARVSIDPERYVVWISTANHTYEVAARTDVLAVHLLGPDDHDLAELFGGLTADDTADHTTKLERCGWAPGPGGVPLLEKVPARLVGRVVDVQVGVGDHVGFVLETHHQVQRPAERRSARCATPTVTDIDPGHPVGNAPQAEPSASAPASARRSAVVKPMFDGTLALAWRGALPCVGQAAEAAAHSLASLEREVPAQVMVPDAL